MSRLRRRPSPALVIALMALFLSLGGGGYAAVTSGGSGDAREQALARGSVRTADLANSAVTSAKIRNRAIRSVDYANGSVGSRAIADGGVLDRDLASGISGAKVTGTVPSAAQASSAVRANEAATAATATAVAGVTARRISYAPATATGAPVTVLDVGGLSLQATCAGGVLGLTARTAASDAVIAVASTNAAGLPPTVQVARDADFDVAETLVVPINGSPIVQIAYVARDGVTVTADLMADDGGAGPGGAACVVGGTALAGLS